MPQIWLDDIPVHQLNSPSSRLPACAPWRGLDSTITKKRLLPKKQQPPKKGDTYLFVSNFINKENTSFLITNLFIRILDRLISRCNEIVVEPMRQVRA